MRPKPVPVQKEVDIGKNVVDNEPILSNRRIPLNMLVGFVAVLLVLGIFIFRPVFATIFARPTSIPSSVISTSTSSIIDTPVATQTPQLETTDTPSPTQTSIVSVPTLGIGSTMISDKDGMTLLYVPAGEFTMGSENGRSDEKPVRKVTIDAFWIDQTEVTNAMYAKCVSAGSCKEQTNKSSSTHVSYYGNVEFDNYPVIYMDWYRAKTYCDWADRRLPTEAEWEKAARGENAFTYPWGNDVPNGNLLNYNSNTGDTTEVGKYPNGASPYGALDMAGNVWEWVNDWYDSAYYASSPTSDPLGPYSGDYLVYRGGSWSSYDMLVRSSNRGWSTGNLVSSGFRCSRSP